MVKVGIALLWSARAFSGVLDAAVGNHTLQLECADAPPTTGRTLGLISIVRADVNNSSARGILGTELEGKARVFRAHSTSVLQSRYSGNDLIT